MKSGFVAVGVSKIELSLLLVSIAFVLVAEMRSEEHTSELQSP